MLGAPKWRVSGDLRVRVKLRDAMIDSCKWQGYLRNQFCQKGPQCVYHCSFLTDQNILAGLSASASEIGLVFGFRARAWHSTSERYRTFGKDGDSSQRIQQQKLLYTLSLGH